MSEKTIKESRCSVPLTISFTPVIISRGVCTTAFPAALESSWKPEIETYFDPSLLLDIEEKADDVAERNRGEASDELVANGSRNRGLDFFPSVPGTMASAPASGGEAGAEGGGRTCSFSIPKISVSTRSILEHGNAIVCISAG